MGNLWTRRERKTALWRGIGIGAGLGAGLMYLLDPDRGRRRRALVRDKAVHLARVTERTLEVRSREMKNRAQGFAAQIRSLLRGGNGRQNLIEQTATAPQDKKESTARRRPPAEPSGAGLGASKSKESSARPS